MFARRRKSSHRRTPWSRRLLRLLVVIALLAAGLWIYGTRFHPERENVPAQRTELAARRVEPELARVDARQVLADLQALSDPAMQGRKVGTPGGARARAYLVQRFREIGLAPLGAGYDHAFTFTPGRGIAFWRAKFWQARPPVHGVNVLGQIRGSVEPGQVIVVSAHYDHLGVREGKLYPGADDNASGVATMLALARWFRAHPPRHSLLFVAFDGEERGLRGSLAFVAAPPVPLQSMLVDVNFDMVSRNKDGEIFASGLYANPQLRPLLEPVRATAKPAILYGHDSPRPIWDMDDWTDQSDQGSFADKGVPFIYLGVADHPDYHQPGDTFEHIDPPFFLGVVESTIDLVSALDAADASALRKAP